MAALAHGKVGRANFHETPAGDVVEAVLFETAEKTEAEENRAEVRRLLHAGASFAFVTHTEGQGHFVANIDGHKARSVIATGLLKTLVEIG